MKQLDHSARIVFNSEQLLACLEACPVPTALGKSHVRKAEVVGVLDCEDVAHAEDGAVEGFACCEVSHVEAGVVYPEALCCR